VGSGYHLPIASNTNVKVAGAFYQTSTWYVLEGGINPDGSPESLGEELSNDVISDGETPDPREIISDNFEPMSQNEFVLGYEPSERRGRWAYAASRGASTR
jgi:hypothetical protein